MERATCPYACTQQHLHPAALAPAATSTSSTSTQQSQQQEQQTPPHFHPPIPATTAAATTNTSAPLHGQLVSVVSVVSACSWCSWGSQHSPCCWGYWAVGEPGQYFTWGTQLWQSWASPSDRYQPFSLHPTTLGAPGRLASQDSTPHGVRSSGEARLHHMKSVGPSPSTPSNRGCGVASGPVQ